MHHTFRLFALSAGIAVLTSACSTVTETGRQEPNLLDTLAEVEFQSGDGEAAVETIDEAIALAPNESYFHCWR